MRVAGVIFFFGLLLSNGMLMREIKLGEKAQSFNKFQSKNEN